MEVENSSPNQYDTKIVSAAKNEQTTNKRPSDASTEDQAKKVCSGTVTSNTAFTTGGASATSGKVTSTTTTTTTVTEFNTYTAKSGITTMATSGVSKTKSCDKTAKETTGTSQEMKSKLSNVTTKETTSYATDESTGESSVATETQMTFSELGIQIQRAVKKTTTFSTDKKQEGVVDVNNEKVVQTTKIASTEIKSSAEADSINTGASTSAQLCCYFDTRDNTITYIDTIPSKTQTTTTITETLYKGMLTSRETETVTETVCMDARFKQTADAHVQSQPQTSTQVQTQNKTQAQAGAHEQQSQTEMQMQKSAQMQAQVALQSQVKTQECQSETDYQLEQTTDITGEYGVKSSVTQFGVTKTTTTETYNEDGSCIVKKEQTNTDGTKTVTVTTTTRKTTGPESTRMGKDMCYTGTTTMEYYSFDGTQMRKTQQIFDKTVTQGMEGGDKTIVTTKVDGVTGDCEMTAKKQTITEKEGKVVEVIIEQTFGNGKTVKTTFSTDNTNGDFVEGYVSDKSKTSVTQTSEQATFDSDSEFTTSNCSTVTVVTTDSESKELYRRKYTTKMTSLYSKSSGDANGMSSASKATGASEVGCTQMSKTNQEGPTMNSANTLSASKTKTQSQTKTEAQMQNQNVSQN
ncbi:hypothetical protein FG386_000991 [Cryptosporidium ryanae]|uniref:uncharacterized protein n=1 Tax=Cryptosporidium ryanae TaxID=515981 RepID=UPI00351A0B68|nr:hypothetical protein FG386_000991 [Cryptosporidium ryanae]